MSAGLVTLHLAPGQRLGDLIQAIRVLTGDVHVRTVSGRAGVLVDAETALQYLWTRLEYGRIEQGGVVELLPEPAPQVVVAEDAEPAAPVKPAKRTAKKAAPAADKIEEV